jgi:hypothetical protein
MSKILNIPLVKDTISKSNIDLLIDWLKTNPRLTKSDLTVEFENLYCEGVLAGNGQTERY